MTVAHNGFIIGAAIAKRRLRRPSRRQPPEESPRKSRLDSTMQKRFRALLGQCGTETRASPRCHNNRDESLKMAITVPTTFDVSFICLFSILFGKYRLALIHLRRKKFKLVIKSSGDNFFVVIHLLNLFTVQFCFVALSS